MQDNYPAGVSDSHPHFNPQEGSVHVVCGNDEAKVIPAYAMHVALEELRVHLESLSASGWAVGNKEARAAVARIEGIKNLINDNERDADYECPFEGVMDVDISEEAEWTCPLCGATRTSDTLPEDRDPDEGWDSRHDD